MDSKRMGLFLKALRKERNLTQEQLAEALYVSSKTVSRWETGSVLPDLSMLHNISDYFGVDIKELINGERKTDNMEQQETLRKLDEYNANKEKRNLRKLGLIFGIILLSAAAIVSLVYLIKRQNGMNTAGSTKNTPSLRSVSKGYSTVQAEYDGCVVMDGNELKHGQGIWEAFLQKTQEQKRASVRIYYDHISLQEQPDNYRIADLVYDGSQYRFSYYERSGEGEDLIFRQKAYPYLREEEFKQYEIWERYYLLTDDLNTTYSNDQQFFTDLAFSMPAGSSDHLALCIQWSRSTDLHQFGGFGSFFQDLDDDNVGEKCYLGDRINSGSYRVFSVSVFGRDNGLWGTQYYIVPEMSLKLIEVQGKYFIQGIEGSGSSIEFHHYQIESAPEGGFMVTENGEPLTPISF